MYEAQELFRLAPNLTRPEKAIILGFIAGNRENPYPDQGDIIRVSESYDSSGRFNFQLQKKQIVYGEAEFILISPNKD